MKFRSQLIFTLVFGSQPFAVAVGDVNKDNLTDVIVTNDGYGNNRYSFRGLLTFYSEP